MREPMPGFPDLFTILVILAVIFGASLLPRMGESVGRFFARRAARKREGEGEESLSESRRRP
jgi:Sec-independent protein translocase protein TatA